MRFGFLFLILVFFISCSVQENKEWKNAVEKNDLNSFFEYYLKYDDPVHKLSLYDTLYSKLDSGGLRVGCFRYKTNTKVNNDFEAFCFEELIGDIKRRNIFKIHIDSDDNVTFNDPSVNEKNFYEKYFEFMKNPDYDKNLSENNNGVIFIECEIFSNDSFKASWDTIHKYFILAKSAFDRYRNYFSENYPETPNHLPNSIWFYFTEEWLSINRVIFKPEKYEDRYWKFIKSAKYFEDLYLNFFLHFPKTKHREELYDSLDNIFNRKKYWLSSYKILSKEDLNDYFINCFSLDQNANAEFLRRNVFIINLHSEDSISFNNTSVNAQNLKEKFIEFIENPKDDKSLSEKSMGAFCIHCNIYPDDDGTRVSWEKVLEAFILSKGILIEYRDSLSMKHFEKKWENLPVNKQLEINKLCSPWIHIGYY
jgi:hypothetical protein